MNTQLKQQQNWLVTSSLSILALVAIAFVLRQTRDVLVPFVVAIFIGSLVAPLMDKMVLQWKWRHSVAVLVALFVVVVATALFGLVLMGSIRTVVNGSTEYSQKFRELSNNIDVRIKAWMPDKKDEADESEKPDDSAKEALDASEVTALIPQGTKGILFEFNEDGSLGEGRVISEPTESTGETDGEADSPEEQKPVAKTEEDSLMQSYLLGLIPELAKWTAGNTLTLFSGGILTLIFVMFVLAGRDPRVVRQSVYSDIDTQVRKYISIKVWLSLATGFLVWVILRSIGMPMAGVFALLAFLLNFIPSIGSIIATLIPIPFALATYPELFLPGASPTIDQIAFLVGVITLPGAVQVVMGNVVEPKMMGDDLQLHPITIMLALAVWGLLWGLIGMILAVPMTGIIRIVLMKFEITRTAGEALAGKLPDLDAKAAKANGDVNPPQPAASQA